MRHRRTTRIALITVIAVYLYASFTLVAVSASGRFDNEVPLLSHPPPTSISTTLTATPTAITLISPDDKESLDNGRTDFLDYRVWDFDWSDVEGATRYHLFVVSPLGLPHIDNDNITSSSYHLETRGYQTSDCLEGWTWGVRAYCNGQWNEWSDTQEFDVEPPDTDTPMVIDIPIPPIRTPTPATAKTPATAIKPITMENILSINGSFPFVLPFLPFYILWVALNAEE